VRQKCSQVDDGIRVASGFATPPRRVTPARRTPRHRTGRIRPSLLAVRGRIV